MIYWVESLFVAISANLKRNYEKQKPFDTKAYAIAILRRGSYRLKARGDAFKAAKIGRNQYVCKLCKQVFGRKDVQADHIIPVVKLTGWSGFDDFISRLYTDKASDFQILCKPHHKEKSKNEAAIRKFHRDNALAKHIAGKDNE